MRGLIEQYYLPHKNVRKRMPVIHNAIGKRDLFSWHKRIYYVGSHNCFQKANWFAKNSFFCIASNSTRNSLIVLFYPIHCTVLWCALSQRSNAKIYLSSGSASLQTFQETDTKICETFVDYSETESNARVCYELRIL